MGLTFASVGKRAAAPRLANGQNSDLTIALVGNPNVGKSTVFNCLTGMHQHTGNWPGKTVAIAQGRFEYGGRRYTVVDLPGTYSFHSKSPEEEVTAEFIRSLQADVVLVVCDATCLERNLILALQTVQLTRKVALCLNLMDEARRAGLHIDPDRLSQSLGIPVVPTSAGRGEGMDELKRCLRDVASGDLCPSPNFQLPKQAIFTGTEEEKETFLSKLYVEESQRLAELCEAETPQKPRFQEKIDRFLTGKVTGGLTMLLLLLGVFWLTIKGANYPSDLLQRGFDLLGGSLQSLLQNLSVPTLLRQMLLDGVYATTARVVAVMLPPMAIFFPLLTLLEDLGYLPRVAFMLDNRFEKCGSCGKQALTMCMGFGCNAAGVLGCRIIDSQRERKIAMLTNSLVPCNGRFPLLIALISVFFAGEGISGALASTAVLTALILLSVGTTFAASALLHKTVYRGTPASFAMEMPPFRRPKILQILYRSVIDRTLCVLSRAIMVAAPAGLTLWCAANIHVAGTPILLHISSRLDPFASLLGLNGAILTAFLFAFPANELVLPVILLILGSSSAADLLTAGWTAQTAVCTMIFCLFHWPCSTTCLTIYKESKSLALTLLSILLPTLIGMTLCFAANCVFALWA